MLEDNDPRLRRIQALQRSYRALQSDLPDLDERIRLLRVLVAEAYTDHTRLPAHRYDLATALYSRFMHTREFSDLDEAEPCVRLALSSPMLGTQPEFPGPSSLLGSILRERAYETKAVEASEEAVSLHRLPFQGEHRMATSEEAYHSRELGQTLRVHSTVTAVDETLVLESIERLKDAQRLFALQEVVDHDTALGLGGALQALYDLKMNRPHLEEANSYGMVALTACGKSHRDFYRVVTTSAHLQYLFAWYYNQLDLLDGAIGLLRAALLDVPAGWAGIMTIYLAGALQLRFTKQTREDDLSEAITRVSTMLLSLTPDHTSWDKLQQVLGMTLFTRFQLTGASEDIEGATRAAGLALSRSNAGSVAYLRRLNIFATCRAEQYKAYGNVGYLSECIGLFEQIKQLADSKSMMWRLATENLLEAFQDRFRHTGNKEDLNRAIDLVPILVAHLNKERADAPLVLLSAGNAFLMRFEADGSAEDLDQATAFHKENADGHAASQPAHLASFEILYLYAKTLRIRYEALDEEESASKALELFNQLYAAVPDAHPERARLLCGLARLRLCASPEEEVEKALDYLLDSLNNNYCLAYKRLGEVSSVLTYLASRAVSHTMILRNASKLTAVYATAIALLPEAASFGLEASTRVAVVASAGQLTNQGALYAIISGQPQVGLQLLEAGRNIFWTQCLHLRTSFADLPEAMGDNLTKIARALERPFPDALEGAEKDDELTRRRQLGDDFRAGIAEARLLPGFEDLLQNTPFASLARAAQHRPIVVLVAGENSSHAIIIFEDPRCQLVTLARATAKILQALSRGIETYNHSVRSTRGMRKVNPVQVRSVDAYHELWCLVMLPIVEALGWPKAKGRDRRRLTLCPTGVFMHLPLHAAGVYSAKEQVSCSDYFVSSYTPSIAALLHAQRTIRPIRKSVAEMLLVAVHHPSQGIALPMTTEEAKIVMHHASQASKVVQASTRQDVLERIQSAAVVHFACHATQNPADALQSGFHLEDDLLAVSRLMELELPQAFLAVLSACETAKGDAAQPDQAIHLAAAMLFAGFKSIVATMWSMGDLEGPIIAESIYSALFDDANAIEHLDPEIIPYALEDAVQKLRDSGLDSSFWATYVHIGI